MKTINHSIFNKSLFFAVLSILLITSSCEDESQEIIEPGPETGVNETLIAEVANFAGTSEKVYKLSSALLTNGSVTDLDITNLFNVKDDEFIFSTEGNGDLSLAWHEGFGFNVSGIDDSTVMSDTRASSKFQTLAFNEESLIFSASGNSYSYTDGLITGTLALEGGASLEVELTQKTVQDYLQPPTSIDTITELFAATNGSVWSGFKGSIVQDQLFLTNYNWPPSAGEVTAFKFDLSTNGLSSFSYNQEDHPWINLEVIDNNIYNVGGSFYQSFDLDFDQLVQSSEITNSTFDFGSAAQDDEIYLFAGILSDFGLNEVGRYNVEDGVVDIIGSLPEYKAYSDGEIINNKIYILGGHTGLDQSNGMYKNMIFDLANGATEIITTDIALRFTSTAVVENIIYYGGQQVFDEDGDGVFETQTNYLGAFDTQNNSTMDIALNFDMLENERIYKLWATEDFIYFVLTQNQPDGSANLRVVRAPLN